jgi:site-specific DNA-cytosine methylase
MKLERRYRVLVACEFSGTVRDAFRARGISAISCDFLPSERPGPHYIGNALDLSDEPFDLVIAHPPCTHLAVSGAAKWHEKQADGRQEIALLLVKMFMEFNAPRICIENPVGKISTAIRKPDQIVHPWQFGHAEQKTTCLWLSGLPLLEHTDNVREHMLTKPKRERERLHYLSPSADRWKERSRTFKGIAEAMSKQWGALL